MNKEGVTMTGPDDWAWDWDIDDYLNDDDDDWYDDDADYYTESDWEDF